MAASGVMHDVPAGESLGRRAGRPVRQFLREVAWHQPRRQPARTASEV